MTSRVRVSLGNQRLDRPQGWAIAAAAGGGLVGGLLLVLVLGRSLAPDGGASADAPGAEISPAAAEPALELAPVSASEGAGVPAAVVEAPVQREPPSAVEPAASVQGGEAAPAPDQAGIGSISTTNELPIDTAVGPPAPAPAVEVPAVPAAATARELVHGQIAYLRCEGVPLQDGPFPCPRDRRFEKQVWAALDRLPQCPGVPASNGDVELRIEFRTRGRHSFELRAFDGSEALASAARACLAADLELVRTTLRPLLMTVAFRFELH